MDKFAGDRFYEGEAAVGMVAGRDPHYRSGALPTLKHGFNEHSLATVNPGNDMSGPSGMQIA